MSASTSNSTADVRHRFSNADAAGRWNALYAADTESLEDENFRLRRDSALARIVNLARPGSRMLDLGCGSGPVLAELRRRGIDAVGLDASPDMLENARRRLRSLGLDEAGLQLGDCRAAPYPAASFDVVACLGVISYVEDYEPVLDEIVRLLKPGGTALVSFRSCHNPVFSDPLALARRLVRGALTPLLGHRRPPPFEIGRFLDHREVCRKIERRGLRYVEFVGIGVGPFRLAGKKLFSERHSIRISRWLSRKFAVLGLHRPLRWLTDVSLWVYEKPGR